jgi:DNA polymerase elongation subunit (family B)
MSYTTLFVDIETIPLVVPVNEDPEVENKGALSPITGSVALIGYTVNNETVKCLSDEVGEGVMLQAFWEMVWGLIKQGNFNMVGHNITGFDADFLIKRAWKYGIKVPYVLTEDLAQYRPKRFLDTMNIWCHHNKKDRVKLVDACNFFGIDVKTSEVKGKDFYKWWAQEGSKFTCKEYCKEDVFATRQLFNKFVELGVVM